MCRLLAVRSTVPFAVAPHLSSFARIARDSREYQGHGWGCALLEPSGRWRIYRNITPVWQDDLEQFGRTTHLVAHARSAFRNEGIKVDNNMPFGDERFIFIFNGELHGVRIREQGRIGAEKIFNLIRRIHRQDMAAALARGVELIKARSRYVRAMNIIISDPRTVHVSSLFNTDAEYFTMHYRQDDDQLIVCSEVYGDGDGWKPIDNGSVRAFP